MASEVEYYVRSYFSLLDEQICQTKKTRCVVPKGTYATKEYMARSWLNTREAKTRTIRVEALKSSSIPTTQIAN